MAAVRGKRHAEREMVPPDAWGNDGRLFNHAAGGQIVVQGSPDEIIKSRKSYTARYLKAKLEADKRSAG